ncbi:uncharacterized protein LOC108905764 [Anoplophora glabripennis]|uniref:uncharacterized protein LOC108905764 n=1 Tax=Anoplophora glabripennis TaxID=217634 RepID=UPI0008750E27|nr:uncharacterized protein LOC108905764 [Anoplophora glabripennis]
MKRKCEKIINFGKLKKLTSFTLGSDNTKNCVEALKVVAKHFKEQIDDLLHKVQTKDNLENLLINSPCIVISEDDKGTNYHVAIEKELINNGTTDFVSAFQQCYAMYYICNMQYPKSLSCTFEFVQRYYMKTHPDQGTKSKIFSASKKKVIALMKKLTENEG